MAGSGCGKSKHPGKTRTELGRVCFLCVILGGDSKGFFWREWGAEWGGERGRREGEKEKGEGEKGRESLALPAGQSRSPSELRAGP